MNNQTLHIETAAGIRGLAVLIVLVYHCVATVTPEFGFYSMKVGLYGVSIFFVLSTFLLSNKFIISGYSPSNIFNYVIGRLLRILPLFALAVFVYHRMGYFDLNKFYSIMKFNSTYFHLWTVPIEFVFYFMLPFLLYISLLLSRHFNLLYSMLFLIISALTLSSNAMPKIGFIGGDWYPVFILGIVISLVYNKFNISIKPFNSDIFIMFSVLLIILFSPGVFYKLTGYMIKQNQFSILLWGCVSALFFISCLYSSGWIKKMLLSSPLNYLGKWSFSIYLFHWAIVVQAEKFGLNNPAVCLLAILQSIGLGAVIYYLVESPIEKLRHYIVNISKQVLIKTENA